MPVRVRKWWGILWGERGQGISEYAVLLILLLLIVVTTVRMMGTDAQHVMNKVNNTFGAGPKGDD